MTLATLTTLMQTWLDDPNGGYFTDTVCKTFLNNAQKQVQKKLIQSGELWYTTTVQTTLVINTESYALPTDFLRLHKAEIIVSGTYPNQSLARLRPITPVQRDRIPQGAGLPCAYFINKGSITLAQTPSVAYVLQMLYSYLVADMVLTTDVPDVPTQYHEMIAIYATLDGFLKDQRNPNPVFATKLQMYEEAMKQDAQERHVDEPREVVMTDEAYSSMGW